MRPTGSLRRSTAISLGPGGRGSSSRAALSFPTDSSSVCSFMSDATVQVEAFSAPSDGDGLNPGSVSCPAGSRALSGGLGADVVQGGDRLIYSGPRDGAGAFLTPTAKSRPAGRWPGATTRDPPGHSRRRRSAPRRPSTQPPASTPLRLRRSKLGGPKKRIFKPRATFRFRSSRGRLALPLQARPQARPLVPQPEDLPQAQARPAQGDGPRDRHRRQPRRDADRLPLPLHQAPPLIQRSV